MLGVDIVWLSTMSKRFYSKFIGHLMADKPELLPALVFYLIYIAGVTFFVVIPGLKNNYPPLKIFLTGALLGLMAYGTYDLTNQATLKNWPVLVTLVDLVWGAFLTGAVSIIAVIISKNLRLQ